VPWHRPTTRACNRPPSWCMPSPFLRCMHHRLSGRWGWRDQWAGIVCRELGRKKRPWPLDALGTAPGFTLPIGDHHRHANPSSCSHRVHWIHLRLANSDAHAPPISPNPNRAPKRLGVQHHNLSLGRSLAFIGVYRSTLTFIDGHGDQAGWPNLGILVFLSS